MLDIDLVLAKLEATYGTDSVPVVGTDVQIVYDWQPQPMQYDELRRPIDRGFAGATPKLLVRGRQSHSFKFELAGSGTADTAARWGSLWLRACMFKAPTISAGVEVTYPLETANDGASLTFHGRKDSLLMQTQGFRGNAKLNFTAGAFPYGQIDGMGLLTAVPSKSVPGAPTLPTAPGPVEVNSANTAFSLGGYAALLRSFELDLGMKTTYRDLVGYRGIIFDQGDDGDRRAVKGSLVIELPDPDLKEYFTSIPARTAQSLSLVHGTTAGNIIDLASTKLFLDAPTFSAENNRLMMSASFELVPDAAGNELTLKTR